MSLSIFFSNSLTTKLKLLASISLPWSYTMAENRNNTVARDKSIANAIKITLDLTVLNIII